MKRLKKIFATLSVLVAVTVTGVAAQTHEASQHVSKNPKFCEHITVNLGFTTGDFGHACTPDFTVSAVVHERITFSPNPAAQIRVEMQSPASFDSGWIGIKNGKVCNGIPKGSLFGQGIRDCIQVTDLVETADTISFHVARGIEVGFGFPHIGEVRQEFTWFSKTFKINK